MLNLSAFVRFDEVEYILKNIMFYRLKRADINQAYMVPVYDNVVRPVLEYSGPLYKQSCHSENI